MYLFVINVLCCFFFFFFKQKTADEMRISDWSSDVCSSDLQVILVRALALAGDTRRGSTAFLRYLKRLADERISAREALILSTSHGGRWFVYEPAAGAPEPLDRFERDSPLGQAFASDLAGLGYISPLIPAAVVAAWRGPIGMSITADALPAPSLMGSLGEDTAAFSPLPSDYWGRLFVEIGRATV